MMRKLSKPVVLRRICLSSTDSYRRPWKHADAWAELHLPAHLAWCPRRHLSIAALVFHLPRWLGERQSSWCFLKFSIIHSAVRSAYSCNVESSVGS